MLSIILPTYQEEENILELVARINQSLNSYSYELVVVDDNSPDGTAKLAEELNKTYGNIRVLKRPRKIGLASAIVDGIEIARGDVIAVMDADLQHTPELLPEMLRKIKEGYDVVVASRYVDGGKVEGWSLWRRLISRGAILLAHILLPKTRIVKDAMSGYFVFEKNVLDEIRLNPIGYKLLVEVLAKGKWSKVAEVPYTFKPRRRGKSKLGLKDATSYILFLIKIGVKIVNTTIWILGVIFALPTLNAMCWGYATIEVGNPQLALNLLFKLTFNKWFIMSIASILSLALKEMGVLADRFFLSLSAVATILVYTFMLGEAPTLMEWIVIMLVMSGVLMIGR